MPTVLRILDANANRAREALRVMEEAARFLLDDAELAAPLKQLRHDLADALSMVEGLESSRDTAGDIGTELKTDRELDRQSAADVVIAAGKRLSEALRVLEEYGKTLDEAARDFAPAVERLRYRGYELEQKLLTGLGIGHARKQWRLCILISEALCLRGDWLGVVRSSVDRGADSIQLREKSLDDAELLGRARQLVEVCRPRGVAVIINDRPDIALLGGADGVHLGQTDLPCSEVRRLATASARPFLIGISTSRLDQARRALRDGADYCGVGPMFASSTQSEKVIVSPEYLRQYVAWGRLPHLAIGGITPQNVSKLVAAGAKGVAVSSAVCSADDPSVAVHQLRAALP